MTIDDMPLGMIVPMPKNTTIPWPMCCQCDGRELNRIEHSDLFALIGITYGEGDGSTTFNIPPKEALPCNDSMIAVIKIKY